MPNLLQINVNRKLFRIISVLFTFIAAPDCNVSKCSRCVCSQLRGQTKKRLRQLVKPV